MIECVIIDDEQNAIDNLIFSLNLFKEIAIVNSFTNPLNALKFLEEHKIDLIFLDIEMPEMDAFEFLEKYRVIKNIINSNYKPYIIITSDHIMTNDNMETSKRYSILGVGNQILKPFDKEDVLDIVEEYLEG